MITFTIFPSASNATPAIVASDCALAPFSSAEEEAKFTVTPKPILAISPVSTLLSVPVSSTKICSDAFASFYMVPKDFTVADSEGPALVLAWCFVPSASEAVVSICAFGVSAIFSE